MKRVISWILTLALLLGALGGLVSFGAAILGYFRGDSNGDGNVNGLDVLRTRKYLSGQINAEDCNVAAMDVNGDGVVDENDLPGLRQIVNGVREKEYVDGAVKTVAFDTEEATKLFSGASGMVVRYVKEYGAVAMTKLMGEDPSVYLDLEQYGISASQYPYIVYTYMVPAGTSGSEGELFYAVGDVTERTDAYASKHLHLNDGKVHSRVFELTNAAFWSGSVHGMWIRPFTNGTVGDTLYLSSVTFCTSYESAAAKIADDRSSLTNLLYMFDYGLYDDGDMQMAYRMYIPANYSMEKQYPVLTLLHAAAHKGTDGSIHLTAGFPLLFDEADDPARESIVFAPQSPDYGLYNGWVDTPWPQGYGYTLENTPESAPMQAAVRILENIDNHYSTDPDRYYVTGASMGGYGTWDLLTRHSELFAAGMPLCGAASKDASTAQILKDVDIWAFHGTADETVPESATRSSYNAIVRAGGTRIRYTPLEGFPHNIWDEVYRTREYIDWLFAQNRQAREAKAP